MRIERIWPGRLLVVLRAGEVREQVPAHIDCLLGVGRPVNGLDGGSIDRVLNRYGEGARCTRVFHAKASLGETGARHRGYSGLEERLGLSRVIAVRIADPQHSDDVVHALQDLNAVESATVQRLSSAPLAEPLPVDALPADVAREQIHSAAALEIEPGDERVTTAVADTGIVVGHPEFQRKCLAGYDTVDLGMGRLNEDTRLAGDSRGHDYNPYDDVGHGCQVAGIIGAQGFRSPRGAGGRTLILPVRVLAAAVGGNSARRVGVGSSADIDSGIKVAVDLGADVINMSFGTPASGMDPDAPKPHSRAVKYAIENGCTLVAAAGNSGLREQFYPAALEDVIAVGSVGAENRRSPFSTWGAHIALCAPGERIVSASRKGYAASSGTSFAAPFVTGTVALMLAHARRANRRLKPAEVRDLLLGSVTRVGNGYSEETGQGLLNAEAAVRAVGAYVRGTP